MQLIAIALDMPAASFFAEDAETSPDGGALLFDIAAASRDGLALNRAFVKIKDPVVRSAIVRFVTTLSEAD